MHKENAERKRKTENCYSLMENCYNIAEADASDRPKAPLDRIKGSWLAAGQTEGIKAVNFRCTSPLHPKTTTHQPPLLARGTVLSPSLLENTFENTEL